jgi:hypothetical protein
MKFRKKPVTIEAAQVRHLLHRAKNDWSCLPEWIKAAYEDHQVVFGDKAIHIQTSEGEMRADIDDWVIRGVKGEIYPCKPDIFEMTYESADQSA